jgi:hypothetical protein
MSINMRRKRTMRWDADDFVLPQVMMAWLRRAREVGQMGRMGMVRTGRIASFLLGTAGG